MKKMLQVRIEQELWMELRLRSVRSSQSLANYVEVLLKDGLKANRNPLSDVVLAQSRMPIPEPPIPSDLQTQILTDRQKQVLQEIPAVIPVKKSVLTRGVVTAVAATSTMTTESTPAQAPPGMTISEAPSGYGGVSSDVQHST